MIFQEPESKKIKKTKTNEEEATKTNDNESKKAKKLVSKQRINKKYIKIFRNIQAKKAAATSSTDTHASSTTVDDKKKSNSLEIHDSRIGNGPEAKLGKTVNSYKNHFFILIFSSILGCCLLYRST